MPLSDLEIKRLRSLPLHDRCHAQAVAAGWYPDGTGPLVTSVCHSLWVALIHAEVSEALEGFRKRVPDKHLPDQPAVVVELADAAIRVFDVAGALDRDTMQLRAQALKQFAHADRFPSPISDTSFGYIVCQLHTALVSGAFPKFLTLVFLLAESFGYDAQQFQDIMVAKLDYNLSRADHDPETRSQEGGKRF